jgi:Ca-activated chloride channel family protein
MKSRLLTLLRLLALAALLAPAASRAQGMLVPTDPSIGPLGLKHHRVDIQVHDATAVTKIEQVFNNHTGRPLEATFFFPTPADAVITDFRLMVNGEMKKGEVVDKDEANRIYTDIVRRLQDPGIVDWMSPTLFKARIFPVPANGNQKVEVTYTSVMPFLDGTYKLAYPLKTPEKAWATLEDFTLTTRIEQSVPLKAVYSPTHRIAVSRRGDHQATVGFEEDKVRLDRDFLLYLGVSKQDIGLHVLTHQKPGESGYFMLMAAPKEVFSSTEIQGKAISFVLDTSGSMQGAKMEHAKKALLWTLDRLGSDDRFNVIRFSSDVERLGNELVAASSQNIERAKAFVSEFEATGGTAIDDALREALNQEVRGANHLVFFITDGRPTIGETDTKAILANAGRHNQKGARIFALGIGDDLNTHLLDQLALAHGGASHYVKPSEDIQTHVAALYNQIAFPVLSDLKLDISAVKTFATLPSRLPDLFKGSQLVLFGRFRGEGDALIRLSGRMGGQEKRYDFEASFGQDSDHPFIEELWAHRQVGFLLDQIRLHGETQALKEEVVQLAKQYGIVTPYTSYLVVEGTIPSDPAPILQRRTEDAPRASAGMPAQAPEAREQMIREAAKAGADFGKAEGAGGVRDAKVLEEYKDKSVVDEDMRGLRRASDRVFRFRDSRWTDEAYQTSLPTLRIAPYSAAWLAVAKAHPKLRPALALGERVVVVIGKLALLVEPGGQTELSAQELGQLKP